jgi:hypothetical protein
MPQIAERAQWPCKLDRAAPDRTIACRTTATCAVSLVRIAPGVVIVQAPPSASGASRSDLIRDGTVTVILPCRANFRIYAGGGAAARVLRFAAKPLMRLRCYSAGFAAKSVELRPESLDGALRMAPR